MEQYEHHFPFRPYLVGVEDLAAPAVVDILSNRDSRLSRQLVDDNIFVLRFNAIASSQPAEGLVVLSDNTCKMSQMLDVADEQLVERFDTDVRARSLASSSASSGGRVRSLVRELQAEHIANDAAGGAGYSNRLAAVLGENFSPQEIEATMAIFGDKYVWECIQRARHEASLVHRADSVLALLTYVSPAARRAIHSAADGLFAAWMGDFDTRSARRLLIDVLGSTEETRRLLERHFVSTLMHPEVTKGGRIRWLPVVAGSETETEVPREDRLDRPGLRVIDGEL